MNGLHQYRKDRGQAEYDSVRGPFLEGRKLYSGAGFRTENHIQICVRNTQCIKGYFLPKPLDRLDMASGQSTRDIAGSR